MFIGYLFPIVSLIANNISIGLLKQYTFEQLVGVQEIQEQGTNELKSPTVLKMNLSRLSHTNFVPCVPPSLLGYIDLKLDGDAGEISDIDLLTSITSDDHIQTSVILLSAKDIDQQMSEQAITLGANACISKGSGINHIMAIIKNELKMRENHV